MKKVIGLLAVFLLCTTVLWANGSKEGEAAGAKKYKIAVVEAMANDESVIRRDYYDNYIAPKYNVEFIFSEQCKNDEQEQTFIENSIDAGADAIITFRGDNIEQMLDLCQENGIYYAINGTVPASLDQSKYENFTGRFGASNSYVATSFSKWLKDNATADGSEGFLLCSSLAFRRNIQHLPTTIGLLNALKDKYGLTYNDTVENIALSSTPMAVPNSKNLNIYIYPGSPMLSDTWLPGVTALLQTGKYSKVMHMGQYYANTAVVVDEVEKSLGKDITVASMASMSDTLTQAFNAKDAFGKDALNMGLVKSISLISSPGFVKVYNALTGHNDLNRTADGKKALEVEVNPLMIQSAAEINKLKDWDIAGGSKWIADSSLIDQVLAVKQPKVTADQILKIYDQVEVKSILNR